MIAAHKLRVLKEALPVTLYGRPGVYYIGIEKVGFNKPFSVKKEYRMVIHRMDKEGYDYTSYFGDEKLSTKYNCDLVTLKTEIDLGNLRKEAWL